MSDEVVYLTLVAGFGFIIVAGAYIGAGSRQSLFGGLFPASGVRDWPKGVQEADAPHFAVAHLDNLRPEMPEVIATSAKLLDDPVVFARTEVVELWSRRLD